MWYQKVKSDIGQLPNFINYYTKEYEAALKDVKFVGSINKNAAALSSDYEKRFTQLQEIESVLRYLEIEFKKLRSTFFRSYNENYNRQLSLKEIERYIEGEEDLVEFDHLINEVALLRNKFISVTSSLDKKNWQITNVTKLRAAGLDEASI